MRGAFSGAAAVNAHRKSRLFFNKALARLIFIDETSTNTKLTGWCAKGQRYRTHAPFGKWRTQTFIAGLRCHGLTAPFIVDAPMNRLIFEAWIETQLAPTLSKGDVVVLDNVGFHKSERAAQLIKQRGAWLLFLPAYSPAQDLTAKTCCTNLRCNNKGIERVCRSFLH